MDTQLINDTTKRKAQRALVGQNCANTNTLITEYLNQQANVVIHGGSVPGHVVINRDREAADQRLFADYFANNPRYDEGIFHRRFGMSQSLFLRIVNAMKDHDNYFKL